MQGKADEPLSFGLLGPLEVRRGETVLELAGRQQRRLLTLLLLHAGRVVARDAIMDALWGERPPQAAQNSLQAQASHLRRLLEPDRDPGAGTGMLRYEAGGYVLTAAPDALDAHRFEQLASEARDAAAAPDWAGAKRLLDQALSLWRGRALGDLADEPFAALEAARLEELRLSAIEERAEAALALGEHAAIVAELEPLVAENPLRERLRGQLMIALYRSGRQAHALARYREGRELLGEELGIDPSPALQLLEKQILQHDPALSPELPAAEGEPERGGTQPLAPSPVQLAGAVAPGAAHGELMGRDAEMAALRDAFRSAAAGSGRIVAVAGPAGIGKTRLVDEATRALSAIEAELRWGRCFEGEGAPAFWPWLQVVRAMVEGRDASTLRRQLGAAAGDLAQIVPEIKDILDDVEPPTPSDPVTARFRSYDAASRFLVRASRERPLIIVLDDVHWADAASLDLLRLVGGETAGAPLLLVCTYRDDEIGEELGGALHGLARTSAFARLELSGLDADAIADVVGDHLGEAPADLVQRLEERTDGNPFFLTQILDLHSRQGPEDSGDVAVPQGISELIAHRVARLPVASQRLLDVAAVAGRDFSVSAVALASDSDKVEVLEILEPAVAARIVVPADPSLRRYHFVHALFAESLVDRLSDVGRARLHAAMGRALGALDRDAHATEIAAHLERAAPLGLADQALTAAEHAADCAHRLLALEQEAEHIAQAVRIVQRFAPDPVREAGLQRRLAMLLLMTEGYSSDDLAAAAQRALELCELEGLPPPPDVQWAVWVYACVKADFDQAGSLSAAMLEQASPDDPAAFIRAAQASGTTSWHVGRLDDSASLLAEVMRRCDELGPAALAESGMQHIAMLARAHAVHVWWLQGRAHEAWDLVGDAQRLAEEFKVPFETAFARLNAAWLSMLESRAEDAASYAKQSMDACRRYGFRQLAALTGVVAGWAQAQLGDAAGGAQRIIDATAEMDATGGRMLRHTFRLALAEAHLAGGDDDAALAAIEDGVAASQASGERFQLADLHRVRAEILARRGDLDEARRLAEIAVELATEQGAHQLAERASATLARLA